MSDRDRCPRCGRDYPYGDPRQMLAGRQCFECDERSAAMRKITIKITGGMATVETSGFKGKACMDATAQLEAAMGKRTSDTKTPEFHEADVRVVGNVQ